MADNYIQAENAQRRGNTSKATIDNLQFGGYAIGVAALILFPPVGAGIIGFTGLTDIIQYAVSQ